MNQERSQAYFTEILFHLTDRLFQEMHIHLFFKKESKIQSGWGLCLKLQKYLHINKMTYLNSGPQWWYNTEWQVEKERMVAISGTIIGYRFEVLRCIWRRGTGIEEAVLYWPDWMSACGLLHHAEHLGKAIALSYQRNLPSVIFILTIICMDNLASRIELDASTEEWIKKIQDIYTMEYYSAVKRMKKCHLQQHG